MVSLCASVVASLVSVGVGSVCVSSSVFAQFFLPPRQKKARDNVGHCCFDKEVLD